MSTGTKSRPFDPLDPLGRIAEHGKRSYDHDTLDSFAMIDHLRQHYRQVWRAATPDQLATFRTETDREIAALLPEIQRLTELITHAQAGDLVLPGAHGDRDRMRARLDRLRGIEQAIESLLRKDRTP